MRQKANQGSKLNTNRPLLIGALTSLLRFSFRRKKFRFKKAAKSRKSTLNTPKVGVSEADFNDVPEVNDDPVEVRLFGHFVKLILHR